MEVLAGQRRAQPFELRTLSETTLSSHDSTSLVERGTPPLATFDPNGQASTPRPTKKASAPGDVVSPAARV